MAVRVVCGRGATIASLVPNRAFNSVDFPALGRPRIATNPALCFIFGCFRDSYLIYAQIVRRQHLDLDTIALRFLTDGGDMSKPLRNESSDGGRLGAFLRPKSHQILQPSQVETPGDHVAAVGLFMKIALGFMFVVNLADD